MNAKLRTIEVDAGTAEALEARAAAHGLSVSEVVAELVESALPTPAADIAELDRQWAEIKAGAPTVPHEKVARWLETWGTPAFKAWREQ